MKRRGCFLFYVYGYCLGLGTCMISTIMAWADLDSVPSKALLTSALCLSIFTLISQAVITCKSLGTSQQTIVRSAINIVGLSITAVATCAGTFVNEDAEGLFFLCGVLSTALYIMTCIAFSVNVYREHTIKNNSNSSNNQTEDRRDGERQAETSGSCIEMVSRFMATDPYLEDPMIHTPYNRPRQPLDRAGQNPGNNEGISTNMAELSVSQLVALGIPPGISLPSYTEIVESGGDLPPKYSDIIMSNVNPCVSRGASPLTSPEVVETDAPPKYDDVLAGRDRGGGENR